MIFRLTVYFLDGSLAYERFYDLMNTKVGLTIDKQQRLWVEGLTEPIIGPCDIKVELISR